MSNKRTLAQWLAYIQTVHHRSIDLELGRVRGVLQVILPGSLPFVVIAVAGTNGKGSTVAMLSSVFAADDIAVGSYTSPHLVHYRERFLIDNEPVDDESICATFELIEGARESVPLTYFEYSTLAAFKLFAQRGVQVAVMEIGMGGRLDAVNAVDADVAVVTNVDLDHQQWLGVDRESIAREKAGIFRRRRPAIHANPDAPAALRAYAGAIGARFFQLGEDFDFEIGEHGWHWRGPGAGYDNLPPPPFAGSYQYYNAAGAVMALQAIKPRLHWSEAGLRTGLAGAGLRGRFEVIDRAPRVILDVAHNAAATASLAANLERLPNLGNTIAVCGMLGDKDIAGTLKRLIPLVDAWHFGTIHEPRGADAAELARQIAPMAAANATIEQHPSVEAAFDRAWAQAAAADRIVVFGSFHTVGDIMRHLDL